jgi:hypothetical protein
MEHRNLVPWQIIAARRAALDFVRSRRDADRELPRLLTPAQALRLPAASNVVAYQQSKMTEMAPGQVAGLRTALRRSHLRQ